MFRKFKSTILPVIAIAFVTVSFALAGTSDFEDETGCITRRGTIYTSETSQTIITHDGHIWKVNDIDIKNGKHVRVLFDYNSTPDPTDDEIVEVRRTLF